MMIGVIAGAGCRGASIPSTIAAERSTADNHLQGAAPQPTNMPIARCRAIAGMCRSSDTIIAERIVRAPQKLVTMARQGAIPQPEIAASGAPWNGRTKETIVKRLLGTTSVLAVLFGGAAAAAAAECGNITIASMSWQSAEVLSNLDKFILNAGYGCSADITVGDTVPTITSMAEKGQPDIAPEGWVDLLPEVVKRGLEEGKLVTAVKSLPDGGIQGWWIPKYVADAHPDIKTIGDALKHPEVFPAPEDPKKGAIYNGPQGWGGTVVTAQLFKAFKAADAGFTLVDTGSAAGLDGSIAKAYERKQGWLGYYWSPTALLGKYAMVKLEGGVPYNGGEWKRCISVADCPDPTPSSWPPDSIFTLVSRKFSQKASPEIMTYLKTRSWSNETVNKLMAWMADNQASGEVGAKHFLQDNPDTWTKWVTPDAAKKIKAAL